MFRRSPYIQCLIRSLDLTTSTKAKGLRCIRKNFVSPTTDTMMVVLRDETFPTKSCLVYKLYYDYRGYQKHQNVWIEIEYVFPLYIISLKEYDIRGKIVYSFDDKDGEVYYKTGKLVPIEDM